MNTTILTQAGNYQVGGANSNGMLVLILIASIGAWCWLGRGPVFLRWPLVVVFVLITSGHSAGGLVSHGLNSIAGPALLLLIVAAGMLIVLRGLSRPRERRDQRPERKGWWENDRE